MKKITWIPLLLSWLIASPSCADFFQGQITHSFPGLVIMDYADFDPDIRKNLDTNPAFITGYFDLDEFEDFAALIRGTVKSRYVTEVRTYDYYESRLVVCHGQGMKKYSCTTLFTGVTAPPEYRYLVKYPPGRVQCQSRWDVYEVKTESIGWASTKGWATGVGEIRYIYQPDDFYVKCSAAN